MSAQPAPAPARRPCPRGYSETDITIERDGEESTATVAGYPYRDGPVWYVEDIIVLAPAGVVLTEAEEQHAVERMIDALEDDDRDLGPDWDEGRD